MTGCEIKQLKIVLLLTAYLFVVLTHIFFIPCHNRTQVKATSCYNSIFKRKVESRNAGKPSLLHRTDKTVLNNKKDGGSLILFSTGLFLVCYFKLLPSLQPILSRRYKNLYSPPYRLYLSSMRI